MRGGARANAGRKSIAEEVQTRDLARTAIIAKYGTLDKGLQALLEMDEPVLTKFVFEHAMGKPTEKHEVDATVTNSQVFEIAGQKIEF